MLGQRWRISSGACELLKWLALASMLVDHVNAAVFDRSLEWATPVGRIAMPVFALVVGYNLARPGVDLQKILARLLLFGTLALPAHAWLFSHAFGIWPLNVMFTFAAAVLAVMAIRRRQYLAAVAIVLACGVLVEYFFIGIGLTVAAWYFFERGTFYGGVVLSLAIAWLCVLNGNVYALLGVALVASAGWWHVRVPRIRWAFWVAYPAHLVVLAWVVHLARGV